MLAIEIEQRLEERIRSGEFPEGTQLPRVRELAAELAVNKNTINRAYQGLQRKGYLELIRGRGAFVIQREPTLGAVDSRWFAQLDQLLYDAKHRAINRDTLVEEIFKRVDQVFQTDRVRVVFIECNPEDIVDMTAELSAAVNHPLEGMHLDELHEHTAEIAEAYDLIVTTFNHLSEVSQILGETYKHKLIGVNAMPAHDTLLKIARLHASVIGLVYETPRAADMVEHLIQAYHSAATVIRTRMKDTKRLEMLIDKADALVATRSTYARVMNMNPAIPVISVTFVIDEQSLDFLRKRIAIAKSAEMLLHQ